MVILVERLCKINFLDNMAKAPNILTLSQLIFVGCAKIKEFNGGARSRVQCDTSIYQGYAIILGQSI